MRGVVVVRLFSVVRWFKMNWTEKHRSRSDIWLQICIGRVEDDLYEYMAHCWELDLIGLGNTILDAAKAVFTAIDVQLEVCSDTSSLDKKIPELFYPCDKSWMVWHINALRLRPVEVDEIASDWMASHRDIKLKVILLENVSGCIEKTESLNECYNLFEVIKNINRQLDSRYCLQLFPVKGNKDYYSLQGIGYSNHVQSYPLPLFQLYNLSAHHISRIIRRFCLQSLGISLFNQIEV